MDGPLWDSQMHMVFLVFKLLIYLHLVIAFFSGNAIKGADTNLQAIRNKEKIQFFKRLMGLYRSSGELDYKNMSLF